jgi:hypothetical protein
MLLKILPFALYTSPLSVQALQCRSCLSYICYDTIIDLYHWVGPHTKHRFQRLLYYYLLISYLGQVFVELLPSNGYIFWLHYVVFQVLRLLPYLLSRVIL